MPTAFLVLDRASLDAARNHSARLPGSLILAPACVADQCGLARNLSPDPSARLLPTADPQLLAWVGPLRLLEPTLANRFDQLLALIPEGRPTHILTRALPNLAASGRLSLHALPPPSSDHHRSEPGGAGPSAGA